MEANTFDDIRPYNDAELREAIKRICQWELIPQILKYIYPQTPVEESLQRLKGVQTVKELQTTFMYDAIRRIVETTTQGFSYSGFDYIRKGKPCLFISNHRDITLDAMLLQMVLIERQRDTSFNVFGNNLMETPLLKDLFLSNKMIQMERGGGNPRAFYRSLQHLSRYLHSLVVEQRQSVWIAQKNGRSKDGVDSTAPAIIKMLTLGSDGPAAQTLEELNITPVAISYEWDPCDLMKANELYHRAHGGYHKVEGEDTNSVMTGIIGDKGHIHLAIGKPLSTAEIATDGDLAEHIASVLDKRIQKLYKLMPTNYLAHDLLTGTSQHRQYYSAEVKNQFLQRMSRLPEGECQKVFMEMYANPVVSARR